ncbi:CD3072 family TudS-related putative desulfidase [Malaciobacter marinus]|uniref:DUF523 domain-containing protein n=1 Tax=Malaciobacter marinus TaxID=505249 RepID=A0A347TJF6_9BACT|nr:CD3072 family TudS-related putative desulfidase [Malaciobacter marinus]AXX86734.1 DUF523 domain-containing protein [Malaciobacter marinus]PHO15938.1 hypothetical protein CPH92_04035 [Malaciobacter marinus]
MQRNKKILLLSHCLLNVNSKVNKIANYGGCLEELMVPLIQKGYGFIQLPCPELLSCGIKRWGQVKEQLDTPYFRKHCEKLLEPIIQQLIDYSNSGYKISACIGVDNSPSCGVNTTCKSSKWEGEIDSSFSLEETLNSLNIVNEKGVFMEVFKNLLDKNAINLDFYAINESNPNTSVKNILKEL